MSCARGLSAVIVPSASHTTSASPRLSIVIASFSRSASIRPWAPSSRSAIALKAVVQLAQLLRAARLHALGQVAGRRASAWRSPARRAGGGSSRSGRRSAPARRAAASTPAPAARDQSASASSSRGLVARLGAPPALAGDQVLAAPRARRRSTAPAGARPPAARPAAGCGAASLRARRSAAIRARTSRSLSGSVAARRQRLGGHRVEGRVPRGGARRARPRRARGRTSPRSRRPPAAATRRTRARTCAPARPRSPGAPRRGCRCRGAATSASTSVSPTSARA